MAGSSPAMEEVRKRYFFLTFCVSAEAATDLAALLAFGSCRIFEAAEATFLLVVSFGLLVCVSADAATDFSALLAVLLLNTVDAAEETFLPVVSDFAMTSLPCSGAAEGRSDEAETWLIRFRHGIAPKAHWPSFLRH